MFIDRSGRRRVARLPQGCKRKALSGKIKTQKEKEQVTWKKKH